MHLHFNDQGLAQSLTPTLWWLCSFYIITHNTAFSACLGDGILSQHLYVATLIHDIVLRWIFSSVCTAIFLPELICSQSDRPTWQILPTVVSNSLNPFCSVSLIHAGNLFSLKIFLAKIGMYFDSISRIPLIYSCSLFIYIWYQTGQHEI